MSVMIYPGTFDPFTNGHLDIARRASKLCTTLYLAILPNVHKQTHFTIDERIEMAKACLANLDNVVVESFDGLLVDYVQKTGAVAVVRGLRSESDFRYELEIATANKLLYSEYESILLPSSIDLAFTSSTIVREVASYGGDISRMVPAEILDRVMERLHVHREER